MYAAAAVPTGVLDPDVNGIGVTYQQHGQQLAILLRRPNQRAQSVAQGLTKQFGVPVGVFVAGEFQSIRPFPSIARRPIRPAPGGVSIGHYRVTNAGTLGCLVQDIKGFTYILSNNHVLANSNNAAQRDPVYQPGRYDGGTPTDEIAKLWTWRPLNPNSVNYVDAALARPNNLQEVDPTILNIGRVTVSVSVRVVGLVRVKVSVWSLVRVRVSVLGKSWEPLSRPPTKPSIKAAAVAR